MRCGAKQIVFRRGAAGRPQVDPLQVLSYSAPVLEWWVAALHQAELVLAV
jgi:hypothetical protein